MGNFEKLSVLVIVVIIVMILVVALYTWTDNPDGSATGGSTTIAKKDADTLKTDIPDRRFVIPQPTPGPTPAQTPGMDEKIVVTPGPGKSPFPPIDSLPTPGPQDPLVKQEPKIHEVVSGDSLNRIAKKYGVPSSAILKANPEVSFDPLGLGKKVVIPEKTVVAVTVEPKSDKAGVVAPKDGKSLSRAKVTGDAPPARAGSVYTFSQGDTLPSVSKRAYGTADRWHEIWIANYAAIENPDLVPPGTRVKLPAK